MMITHSKLFSGFLYSKKFYVMLFCSFILFSGCGKEEEEDGTYVSITFNDDDAGKFTDDGSGLWEVSDGTYTVTGSGEEAMRFSYYKEKVFDDFELSVDISPVDNNTSTSSAHGILFRSQSLSDMDNTYLIVISSTGSWWIGKFVDGTLTHSAWTESENLNTGIGTNNNIRVVCSGSVMEVFLNDISEGTYSYSDFSSGYAGLFAYDPTGYTNTFSFDNFLITEVGEEPVVETAAGFWDHLIQTKSYPVGSDIPFESPFME